VSISHRRSRSRGAERAGRQRAAGERLSRESTPRPARWRPCRPRRWRPCCDALPRRDRTAWPPPSGGSASPWIGGRSRHPKRSMDRFGWLLSGLFSGKRGRLRDLPPLAGESRVRLPVKVDPTLPTVRGPNRPLTSL
jgi:hypothetical protein